MNPIDNLKKAAKAIKTRRGAKDGDVNARANGSGDVDIDSVPVAGTNIQLRSHYSRDSVADKG